LYYQTDKIYSPNLTKLLTQEHINKFANFLQIYTDGSKQNNNRTASATYIPSLDIIISRRIPDNCTVYTSELTAILLALNWILENKPSNIIIFTDSLSSILSLQNIGNNMYKNTIIKEIAMIYTELSNFNTNLIISWIPSHINIKEHDKVDQIAKFTTHSETIQLKIPLNKNEINTTIHQNYKLAWKTEYSLSPKGQFFRTTEKDFDKILPLQLQNRHMETTIYRLRTGHCNLNSHLHKIGLHDSGLCDFCEEPETVKHYILDCLEFQQYQEKIIHFALQNKIKITIDYILKNKIFYPIIYEYVLKTKKKI
jgi:ribonuclease HI